MSREVALNTPTSTFFRPELVPELVGQGIAVETVTSIWPIDMAWIQGPAAARIYDGLDHDEFIRLLSLQAEHGEDVGFLTRGAEELNGVCILGTDYAYVARFNTPQRAQHMYEFRIGDAHVRTVDKAGLEWCQLGTRVFHYA
jgi:hypothetical protein